VKVEINAWLGDTELVELNDEGRIDGNAVKVFTRGHCHSFALALSEVLPNLELVGVAWEEVWTEDDDAVDIPGHVCCRDQAGKLWDITGLNTEDWDAEYLDRQYVLDAFDGEYFDARPDLAQPFLAAWLKAHRKGVAA